MPTSTTLTPGQADSAPAIPVAPSPVHPFTPSPVHPSPPLTTHHSPLTPPDLESAADALLMAEKRRALARVHALRRTARKGGPSAAALTRAADAIAIDHAYYTERQLRRCPIIGGHAMPSSPLDLAAAHIPLPYSSCLRDLIAGGLEDLAAGLGLTGRQAEAWILHVRGEALPAIAASLNTSPQAAHKLLARAHHRVRHSWLAAYRESLRRDAPPKRPR